MLSICQSLDEISNFIFHKVAITCMVMFNLDLMGRSILFISYVGHVIVFRSIPNSTGTYNQFIQKEELFLELEKYRINKWQK